MNPGTSTWLMEVLLSTIRFVSPLLNCTETNIVETLQSCCIVDQSTFTLFTSIKSLLLSLMTSWVDSLSMSVAKGNLFCWRAEIVCGNDRHMWPSHKQLRRCNQVAKLLEEWHMRLVILTLFLCLSGHPRSLTSHLICLRNPSATFDRQEGRFCSHQTMFSSWFFAPWKMKTLPWEWSSAIAVSWIGMEV
jgi:hypothetical protein